MLVLPLACSEDTPDDDASDAGASGRGISGNSGASGSGATAGSAGFSGGSGTSGSAGVAGSGGVAGSAGAVSFGGTSGAGASSAGVSGAGVSGAAGTGAGAGAGSAGNCGKGGAGGGEELAFVPEGLPSIEAPGEEGGLVLVASTLMQGADGLELYVAVRNDGDAPACEIGAMTSFIGADEQVIETVGLPLQAGHLYEYSGAVLNCLPPGEIGMGAALDLPDTIVLEELTGLEHRFPAFEVAGIIALNAFKVDDVEVVSGACGSKYTGVLTNQFERGIIPASITIFPVNEVGRPFGAATATTEGISAGEGWAFETSSVPNPGSDYVALPDGSVNF